MNTPKPRRDIDDIIHELRQELPGVQVTQLQPRHPGSDDDGLWFIKVSGKHGEVQIESPHGDCPFLIESDFNDERIRGVTVSEVVFTIKRLFSQLHS